MDIKGGYDSVAAMRAAGNNHGKVIEISHAGVSPSVVLRDGDKEL
jgi:hypothetical protein